MSAKFSLPEYPSLPLQVAPSLAPSHGEAKPKPLCSGVFYLLPLGVHSGQAPDGNPKVLLSFLGFSAQEEFLV